MLTSERFKRLGEEYQRRLDFAVSSYENWEYSVLDLELPEENTKWLLEYYKVVFPKQEPSEEFFQAMII
ncbi:hypothetical protein CLV59_11087 [Chitinophaga dinghuensis]|uniref:Uncharacterized protein n=1 Tax=Chitinophaga dinghuensis TaxID=1539050 RepID=A0A327VV09_9BACT|nr:hypothetical protein [Chitinophaga dinghuensis]RAJ75041.1 hypothetical protein CLV59_11087 [Chitinophaga dinghuensis]